MNILSCELNNLIMQECLDRSELFKVCSDYIVQENNESFILDLFILQNKTSL